ncbi:MAG: hypothetical protein KR126chlam6_01062 [Candidatus Anoxychlamydiales bacterium]|nr:hypothetical protein [Candidatus Anoxychlamydiales bacterium]
MAKTKKLFNMNSLEPMPLSRSKIDLFLKCPRCFYLDRKLGISQPSGAPFTLNNAVDALLKKEFDIHRKNKTLHPFQIENDINAIPFDHSDIEIWRNNRKGIRYHHKSTNFEVYGAIDDVWVTSEGELIIVDYKAKASKDDPSTFLVPKRKKTGEIKNTEKYKISYKKQLEIYQWLFRKNGFKVSNISYFIFANAQKDKDSFNDKLDFEKHLIAYEGNDDWVEPTLLAIYEFLNRDSLPEEDTNCDYCNYRNKIACYENIT